MESNEQKAEGTANIGLEGVTATAAGTVGTSLDGVTSQATGNVLTPSLYVRLEWTVLADFIEHFERELRGAKASKILGDNRGWLLWGDMLPMDAPSYKGILALSRGKKYTRITAFDVGTTGRNYWIWDGNIGEPETLSAVIQVARYSQRWLRVSLQEHSGGYGERFEKWLRDKWEDGVTPNEPKKSPELPESPVGTEEWLRKAIFAIEADTSTPEWWAQIAILFHKHKRANPKFDYADMGKAIGMEEKHVGKRIRKFHPKTP